MQSCNLLPNYRDTFLLVVKINEDNEDLNIHYADNYRSGHLRF